MPTASQGGVFLFLHPQTDPLFTYCILFYLLLCSIESVHLSVARSAYLQSISWSRSLPRGVRCYNSGSWLRGGVIYADPVIIIHRLVINGIITMIKTRPASHTADPDYPHKYTSPQRRAEHTGTRGVSSLISDRLMPCFKHFEHSFWENMRYKRLLYQEIFQNCNEKNKIFIQFIITT